MDLIALLCLLLFILQEKNIHIKYHTNYRQTNDLDKDFVDCRFYHDKNDIVIDYVYIINCMRIFYKFE